MEKILHSSEKDQQWEYSAEGLLDKKLVYNAGGDPCYVDYDYDAYGKKTETEYPDGGSIDYHRDGYGRLRIVEDNRNASDNIGGISTFAGKLEFDYDSAGRLSKTTNQYGYTVEYTYRSDGQKYSIIVKNPAAQEIYSRYFFYYPDGRLHFICQDNPFTGDIIAVFTYDANGNRKQMQYALEGNEQGNMATIDYEYDRRNHLIDLKATTDISSVETVIFHQDNLTVDGLGRLTDADELINTTTRDLSYSYDMMSQLLTANLGTQWTYGYDYYKDGNLREKEFNGGDPCSYGYNGDIMVQAGQKLLDWDYNGNLSSAFDVSQTWNWDNRLRSATTGTDQVDYKYDHVGTMIYRKHGSDERIFILDYTNKVPTVLMEIALPNGDIEKEYTRVNGQTIRQTDDMGNNYFYVHDRLGSIRLLVDDDGAIKNSYIYDPFGNVVEATETISNPWLFANYRYDNVIGMYYCYQRWYNPIFERFTGYDPVLGQFKEPLTVHAYLYCLNDPLNRFDPDGRMSLASLTFTSGITTTARGNRDASAVMTGFSLQSKLLKSVIAYTLATYIAAEIISDTCKMGNNWKRKIRRRNNPPKKDNDDPFGNFFRNYNNNQKGNYDGPIGVVYLILLLDSLDKDFVKIVIDLLEDEPSPTLWPVPQTPQIQSDDDNTKQS